MINVITYPGDSVVDVPPPLRDANGNIMRFATMTLAKTYLKEIGIKRDCVHLIPEDDDEAIYRDVVESFTLAMTPYIGKVLTEAAIRDIKQTVEDAVGNNIFK